MSDEAQQWDMNRRFFATKEQNAKFYEVVPRLSNGDTGATLILGMIAGQAKGEFNLMIAYYKIVELRGWIGSRLWEVYKDEHKQNFENFFAALMA